MPRWIDSISQLSVRACESRHGAVPVDRRDPCTKARRELAYRPVPLREMFEDCYRWMLNEAA